MRGVQLILAYMYNSRRELHHCIIIVCLVSGVMECTLKIVRLVRGADGVANFITYDEQFQKSGGCSFPGYASEDCLD